jgi:hypothetical protein
VELGERHHHALVARAPHLALVRGARELGVGLPHDTPEHRVRGVRVRDVGPREDRGGRRVHVPEAPLVVVHHERVADAAEDAARVRLGVLRGRARGGERLVRLVELLVGDLQLLGLHLELRLPLLELGRLRLELLGLRLELRGLLLEPPLRGVAFRLGVLALRHVHADAEHARRAPVGVPEQLPARLEPAHLAAGWHDPVLELVRAPLEAVGRLREHALPVVGVDVGLGLVERAAERPRHEAVDALQRVGPVHAPAGDVPLPRAHAAGVERDAQALLALAARLVRVHALGEVHVDQDDAGHRAVGVAHREEVALRPRPPAAALDRRGVVEHRRERDHVAVEGAAHGGQVAGALELGIGQHRVVGRDRVGVSPNRRWNAALTATIRPAASYRTVLNGDCSKSARATSAPAPGGSAPGWDAGSHGPAAAGAGAAESASGSGRGAFEGGIWAVGADGPS